MLTAMKKNKIKTYGVRASMADLARSFAVLASMAVSRDWFSVDTAKLGTARRKKNRLNVNG